MSDMSMDGNSDDDDQHLDPSDIDDLSAPDTSSPPKLKIKIRLPGAQSSSTTPLTLDETARDIDIESEDSDDNDEDADEDAEDDDREDQDRAGSTPSGSGRPMTTRQAVLASVVDSSHVYLNESSRKKKPLNEAEIALRREETARKRKNLSEKKLEDEKAETINRLLKKQSRAKTKRALPPTTSALPTSFTNNTTTDDRTPLTRTPTSRSTPTLTPVPVLVHIPGVSGGGASDAEDQFDDPGNGDAGQGQAEEIPVMYRWVSSTRGGGGGEMKITFSVPKHVLPSPPPPAGGGGEEPTAVGKKAAVCDVDGCTQPRRYRLVQDWTRGACGMRHLQGLGG